jgi:DDE superfamily endonuclease
MRWLPCCASKGYASAVARSFGFSNDTASPLKKSLQATERQRPDVATARRRWIRKQGALDPARLVFIDETAVSTNLVRLRGRAPRGVRVVGSVPLGAWKTLTFVGALRRNKMTAPMVIEGPMTAEFFLAYVEQCLAPTLRRNDIVIMDNCPAICARRSAQPLRRLAQCCAICPNTRLTSIRSRCRSAASKISFAKLRHAPFRPSSERSDPSRVLHLNNVPTISDMRDMLQINQYPLLVVTTHATLRRRSDNQASGYVDEEIAFERSVKREIVTHGLQS